MRQQFAGPLGSSAAMQMPALHFTLGPAAAAAVRAPAGARDAGRGLGGKCMPDVPLSSQEIESVA